jgi:hypothetical protein
MENRMNDYYPEQINKAMAAGQLARPMTLRERLDFNKKELEERLKDVNEAIDALDSHPDILKALEAVQKVSRLG